MPLNSQDTRIADAVKLILLISRVNQKCSERLYGCVNLEIRLHHGTTLRAMRGNLTFDGLCSPQLSMNCRKFEASPSSASPVLHSCNGAATILVLLHLPLLHSGDNRAFRETRNVFESY